MNFAPIPSEIGKISILGLCPERQFLQYAFPCLDARELRDKHVLPMHVAEVREALFGRQRPRRSLLRFVFPDAYRGITLAALDLSTTRWTQASIEKYFLLEHNLHVALAAEKGVPHSLLALCMVKICRVTKLRGQLCELEYEDGLVSSAVNLLDLPVNTYDLVAVHYRIVVDVCRQDLSAIGTIQ